MTPIELNPMSAPAIEGDSMIPETGSNVPAATGIPTCRNEESTLLVTRQNVGELSSSSEKNDYTQSKTI